MIRFLSLADVAEYAGVSHEALKTAVRRGRMPEPDAVIGVSDVKQRRVYGWTTDAIDAWIETRSKG